MVNGEQIARYVDHFAQDAVAWHMHAMVVARGEVSGHKRAVAELIRHQVVTRQQRFKAVIMAFGLQNFIFFDTTQLAYHAVGRHHQDVRIGIERTHVITQRTNKEIIERTIAGGIRFLRLGHIDFVILYEEIDNQFCQPSCSFACAPARQASEP